MKTILLISIGMLLSINTVTAENTSIAVVSKHDHHVQPISFIERGVEFFIFPDGTFDFNANNSEVYSNNSRRNTINTSYNSPRVYVNYSSSRTIRTNISRDRNGIIRSIDNIYLNYDRSGKITRVGSVFIDYENGKKGMLAQVGRLRVKYNKWGEITSIHGFVNQENHFVSNHNGCHNDYVYNNTLYDNDYDYYYKKNGNIKKQKTR